MPGSLSTVGALVWHGAVVERHVGDDGAGRTDRVACAKSASTDCAPQAARLSHEATFLPRRCGRRHCFLLARARTVATKAAYQMALSLSRTRLVGPGRIHRDLGNALACNDTERASCGACVSTHWPSPEQRRMQ